MNEEGARPRGRSRASANVRSGNVYHHRINRDATRLVESKRRVSCNFYHLLYV